MAAASQPMRFFTGCRLNGWMSWTFRRRYLLWLISIRALILQSVARSSREGLCSRRSFLPPGEPAAIRCHFRRTATSQSSGLSQSLYRGIFLAHEQPPKEGGIATFWLPIDLLKVDEAKAVLRAFHNVFANASVWASANEQWIMMGIKGPGRRGKEEEIRQLWSDPASGADLRSVGIETPQQLGALFLMDGEEIDRITRDIAPLRDTYPKRLTEERVDDEANRRFALT